MTRFIPELNASHSLNPPGREMNAVRSWQMNFFITAPIAEWSTGWMMSVQSGGRYKGLQLTISSRMYL
jgi:hypothetical protein